MSVLAHAGDKGKSVVVYFPPAKWYDWYTLGAITEKGGVNKSIETPLDHIPVSRFKETSSECTMLRPQR